MDSEVRSLDQGRRYNGDAPRLVVGSLSVQTEVIVFTNKGCILNKTQYYEDVTNYF